MRILVTGAAGMVGRKLLERVARDGLLGRAGVSHAVLADLVEPSRPVGSSFEVEAVGADLAEPGVAAALVAGRPEVVFHLAAVLSGEAEADFERGYRVNLEGPDIARGSSSARRSRSSARRFRTRSATTTARRR